MAPNATGQIKTTLHTSGRKGQTKKLISVETNDPNQPLIKLTLLANVEVELALDPPTAYFRNMDKGEERNQKIRIKNTSENTLRVSTIDPMTDAIKIDLLNRSPEWPIELKPEDSVDLLVSFHYEFQSERPSFSQQVKIDYTGGKADTAYLRVYATMKREPETPQIQTKQDPHNGNHLKNVKPMSVKTLPLEESVSGAPVNIPPDLQSKEKGDLEKGKAPENDSSPH